MKLNRILSVALTLVLSMGIVSVTNAQQQGTRVTVDNFVRAETDHMIRLGMKAQGLEVGKLGHAREPITAETQTVIRPNQETLYSSVILDSITAKPNEDGSITIHFGGDPKSINYLPITKGWSYLVRLYHPRQEILDGTWTFPSVGPLK